MQTLPNSHHEAFAQLLAQGYQPTFAYREAGFNARNAKARAPRLAKNPNIRARVKALTAALPRIQDLQARFAPSALLMPETKEHMGAILWQIFSGLRPILPVQLRALSLFCRLQGWHLTPRPAATPRARPIPGMPHPKEQDQPAATSSPLGHITPEERGLLAAFALQIIDADEAHQPLAPNLTQTFLAAMTDSLLTASTAEDPSDPTDQTDPSEPPGSSATPTPQPNDDFTEYHNRLSALIETMRQTRARNAATAAAAATGNPPNLHIYSTSQTPDYQPLNPQNPQTAQNSAPPPPPQKIRSANRTSSRSPHDHWSPTFLQSH